MIKVIFLFCTLVIVNFITLGQTTVEEFDIERVVVSIEDQILKRDLDSASYLIEKLEDNTTYINLLKDIISGKELTYFEQSQFVQHVSDRRLINYFDVSDYIDSNIEAPNNENSINSIYVDLKVGQITRVRNDGDIEKASSIYENLMQYINQFDDTKKAVILAKARASSHRVVLCFIQNDLEKGKLLISENLEIASQYDDIPLEIMAKYYLSDFLVKEGKLDEYIELNEQILSLENKLGVQSDYHFGTLIHLIDAYIYKGGAAENRINELLDEVYNNPETRVDSYSLYAKYLSFLDVDSAIRKRLFEKFEVSNTIEFARLAVKETKDVLNLNDFYYVLIECAGVLEKGNYLKEAIRYQEQAVLVNKQVYSQDLSKSLAAFETAQAVKIKDIEISNQKKKVKIYVVASILVGLLLVLSMFFLIKSIKQTNIVHQKNVIIDKALKEKELLIKEVHHRVKNNFQIVSSLLELQTKGIEDEKALELANEGKNRVKSMALIHQKLYQNESGLIDFEEYIQLLVKELTSLYATNKKIQTKVESANMQFDIDTAIPLGLIINEIITNSYKYAFNKIEDNELNISIKRHQNSQNYILTISDNGPGLSDDINLKKAKSLGLRLITRLVKQLQGNLEQTNQNGAKFVITFKDIHARKTLY